MCVRILRILYASLIRYRRCTVRNYLNFCPRAARLDLMSPPCGYLGEALTLELCPVVKVLQYIQKYHWTPVDAVDFLTSRIAKKPAASGGGNLRFHNEDCRLCMNGLTLLTTKAFLPA